VLRFGFGISNGSMNDTLPPCPECASIYVYQVDALLNCPECGHEWVAQDADDIAPATRDSVGNVLENGDTVTVIKDLKIKGSSSVVKVGTKVRGIRLVDGDHDIDCKVPGVGQMGLKSQFVKKVLG
jgi:protein PhnA